MNVNYADFLPTQSPVKLSTPTQTPTNPCTPSSESKTPQKRPAQDFVDNIEKTTKSADSFFEKNKNPSSSSSVNGRKFSMHSDNVNKKYKRSLFNDSPSEDFDPSPKNSFSPPILITTNWTSSKPKQNSINNEKNENLAEPHCPFPMNNDNSCNDEIDLDSSVAFAIKHDSPDKVKASVKKQISTLKDEIKSLKKRLLEAEEREDKAQKEINELKLVIVNAMQEPSKF